MAVDVAHSVMSKHCHGARKVFPKRISHRFYFVGFEVLPMASMNTAVFWVVKPCRLVEFSLPGRYSRKNCSIMAQYNSYSQISIKPTIQSGGKHYTVLSLSLEYPGN
jgi:hypothetical protein